MKDMATETRHDVLAIFYGGQNHDNIGISAMAWWPKLKQATRIKKLSRVQRLAYLGIAGAIKTTPTAELETFQNLPL